MQRVCANSVADGNPPRLASASCLHSAAQRRPNTRAQTLHNTRVRAIPGRHNIVSTGTVNGVLDDFLVNVSAGSWEVRGTVVLHCVRRCSRHLRVPHSAVFQMSSIGLVKAAPRPSHIAQTTLHRQSNAHPSEGNISVHLNLISIPDSMHHASTTRIVPVS